MVRFGEFLAGVSAVVLLGTASLAHAQSTTLATTPPKLNDFAQASDPNGPWTVPYPHKTFAFDNKGRWGVKLDLAQPTNRPADWKDVEAGAYFRVAPNIRVGGTVGLGDKFAQPQHLTPQDTGPRVRLEGAFKF
jgi:hypothetical protein